MQAFIFLTENINLYSSVLKEIWIEFEFSSEEVAGLLTVAFVFLSSQLHREVHGLCASLRECSPEKNRVLLPVPCGGVFDAFVQVHVSPGKAPRPSASSPNGLLGYFQEKELPYFPEIYVVRAV